MCFAAGAMAAWLVRGKEEKRRPEVKSTSQASIYTHAASGTEEAHPLRMERNCTTHYATAGPRTFHVSRSHHIFCISPVGFPPSATASRLCFPHNRPAIKSRPALPSLHNSCSPSPTPATLSLCHSENTSRHAPSASTRHWTRPHAASTPHCPRPRAVLMMTGRCWRRRRERRRSVPAPSWPPSERSSSSSAPRRCRPSSSNCSPRWRTR